MLKRADALMADVLKAVEIGTGVESALSFGSTVHDVQRVLDKPGLLPANVPYTLGGLYEQQQIAFQGLTVILIAAIVLVLLLLLFLYENYSVAIAMLVTTLLAVAGVYIGLWATGTEINGLTPK